MSIKDFFGLITVVVPMFLIPFGVFLLVVKSFSFIVGVNISTSWLTILLVIGCGFLTLFLRAKHKF
jgi:hypothetical protein